MKARLMVLVFVVAVVFSFVSASTASPAVASDGSDHTTGFCYPSCGS